MRKNCIQCGGEVEKKGAMLVCISCGTTYDSEEELIPKKKNGAGAAAPAAGGDHGADVFDKNINGVLEITWSDGKSRFSGSGFLVSENGYAITNTHVVTHENGASAGKVNVKLCGKTTLAEVIKLGDDKHGWGAGVDLALIKLLKVPQEAVVTKLADSSKVKNGESVFVIGNSLGYGTCITRGIISDNHRMVDHQNMLMTDCAINGGNSGGPMFNENGEVIGAVCSGITKAEGMNFAIPSNEVVAFIRETLKGVEQARKASAPCPSCGKWNTFVIDKWFICNDCGFVSR